MRKTTKKKAPAKTKKGETPAETPTQPTYINIREISPELQRKQNLLWLGVGIFSIILVICWLFILRFNIASDTSQVSLSQLSQQINESLARFDTQVKDRATPQTIDINDLTAIKENLETQIKNNPDSSLWPTHDFIKSGLRLQYPEKAPEIT